MPTPDADLLTVLDEASWASFAAFSEHAGGRTEWRDGMLLVIGPHPSPIIVNTAFRTESTIPPGEALIRTIERYRDLGHAFSLITRAHADADLERAAADAGWRRALTFPGMVVEEPLPEREPRPGAALRRANPRRDLESAVRILLDGFAEDSADERDLIDRIFRAPAQLRGSTVASFIASQDGVDGAFALVIKVGETAVVGWVATVPELRRRGLGDLVTRAATNAGFELGAKVVALKASPMGLPVYERMGYREVTRYGLYLPPVSTRTPATHHPTG